MRQRQARAAKAGGNPAEAFEILWTQALGRTLRGGDFRFLRHELEDLSSSLDAQHQARLAVLTSIGAWYEQGSDLRATIPALRQLIAAGDPDAALLSCLVIEQALVDGLYECVPAFSILVEVESDTVSYLEELRTMASAVETNDVVIRARLLCAVADVSLCSDASPEQVGAAYDHLVADALAGRHRHARGW
jgi:hypothetical protein